MSEYVYLTGTGLQVSRVCLGTMTFGGQVDEKTGIEAVAMAVDNGINFIDTANVYSKGESERIVGRALSGRRDRFILASKVGQPMRSGPNGAGLSRHSVIKELEDSLERLRTDYVDLYYMHVPDPHTPAEETLGAMDDLVRSGKVRYIGVSNHSAWQMCRLRHIADERSLNRPVVTQSVYNLLTRGIEDELIPFLDAYQTGLVVFNPLAGGLLTEKYAAKQRIANTRFESFASYAPRYWNEENLSAWDEVKAIASAAGLSMIELAMRWLTSNPRVDSVIIGFSNLDQLRENIAACDSPHLASDTLEACDRVWHGLLGNRFSYHR